MEYYKIFHPVLNVSYILFHLYKLYDLRYFLHPIYISYHNYLILLTPKQFYLLLHPPKLTRNIYLRVLKTYYYIF